MEASKVVERRTVSLEVASEDRAPLLSNLLNLYMHELSDTFPVAIGADGRFQYGKLPLYWSEPEKHFPFLIHCGMDLAGFALVTRGSPATEDPEHLDVAEFFVLRAHRRTGVGRRAAFNLWNRLPGQWVVRVSEANRAGQSFWRATVEDYTQGAFSASTRPGKPDAWHVFTFAAHAHVDLRAKRSR
jgi:predicted acetyltransferase